MRTFLLATLISLAACSAWGQAEVQHGSCEAGTTDPSMTCTYASNVTSGNLLVAVQEGHNALCVTSDTMGNTWHALVQRLNTTGTVSGLCISWTTAISTGSESVTWTVGAGGVNSIGYIIEFSGMTSVSTDTFASAITGSGVTSSSITPAAPTGTPSLFLCSATNVNSTTWSGVTSPSGGVFRVINASNGQTSGANYYKFISGTSSNTCTFTIASTSLRTVIGAGYLRYSAVIPGFVKHRVIRH